MTNLSDVVQDERTARMAPSMLVEPDDAVTGRLLGELGALELLRLAERDDVVPGLSTVDAQVWRAQFRRSDTRTLEQNLVGAERAGIGTLIPGDKEWPSARRSWRPTAIRPLDSWHDIVPRATAQRFRDDHRREGLDVLRRACGRTACLRPRQR